MPASDRRLPRFVLEFEQFFVDSAVNLPDRELLAALQPANGA
jgi:hypothetical protein